MSFNHRQGNPNPQFGGYPQGYFQGSGLQFQNGYPYQGNPNQLSYSYSNNFGTPSFGNVPIAYPSYGFPPTYNHNPFPVQQDYLNVNTGGNRASPQASGQGRDLPSLTVKRAPFDRHIPASFGNVLFKYHRPEPVQTVSINHVLTGVGKLMKVPELPLGTDQKGGLGEKPSGYEVDTYQIAVPNGDCSVHFLVDRSKARSDPRTLGCIVNSVLMDGGNDGGASAVTAAKCLRNALRELRSWYTIMEATGPSQSQESIVDTIRFDAWVITHWDYDHWGGSLEMILTDLQAQGAHKQSRYMKYNQDGEPLTVLYCPNWTKVPDVFAALCVQDSKPQDKEVKKRPPQLSIDDENTVEGIGEGIVNAKVQNDVVKGLCLAKWGPSMLFGRDFFTGERCWSKIPDGLDKLSSFKKALAEIFTTFRTLTNVTAQVFGSPERPRLFCVGAAGFLLGRRISAAALKQALGDMGAVRGDTWANLSSIMTVLHFPGKEYISLYWAGDAVTSIERDLITKPPLGSKPFFDGYTVNVAKWSHHGSSHSSPVELWDTLKPKKFVVSANIAGRYEHPHRDVIKRCYSYFKKHSPELCSSSDRVYALYFPGWIKACDEKVANAEKYKAAKNKAAAKLKAAKQEATEPEAGQANAGKNKTKKGKSSGTDKQQNSVPEDPGIHDWNMGYYEEMWVGLSPNARDRIEHDVFLFGPKTNSTRMGWHSGQGCNLPPYSAKVLFLHVISSANPKRDGAIHMFASYGNAFKAAREKEVIHTYLDPWHNWSPQAQTPRDADPLIDLDEALESEGMLQLNAQNEINWTEYPPKPVEPYYGDDLRDAIEAVDSFESGAGESEAYFKWLRRSTEGIDLLGIYENI